MPMNTAWVKEYSCSYWNIFSITAMYEAINAY